MDGCAVGKGRPSLTPMIDVTFLLLVFFLLATQFRVVEGQIQARLPAGEDGDRIIVIPDETIVTLRPAGRDNEGVIVELSGDTAPLPGAAALRDRLRRRIKVYGSDRFPVVIRPQGRVRWRHVVNAFNQGVLAGCRNVGLGRANG
ncbi:MAG: biopolymer transporter ExbD [Planctomycetota bacterium]|jgi:biopolymer transport protein ExbD